MPWNPEKYHQFKTLRQQPFFDLVEMIHAENLHQAIDLGCGTGDLTLLLSEHFQEAVFLGIDSSEEMMTEARKKENERVRFALDSIEQVVLRPTKWDLVFSNAALQWTGDHESLFPSLIGCLSEQGQLAIQIPSQQENVMNLLLLDLVRQEPFRSYLNGWERNSPVLSMDRYAEILFENGLVDLQLMQKMYPVIAESATELIDYISGTTLMPYLDRMQPEEQSGFLSVLKDRVSKKFAQFPAIYPFKRLLLYGRKARD